HVSPPAHSASLWHTGSSQRCSSVQSLGASQSACESQVTRMHTMTAFEASKRSSTGSLQIRPGWQLTLNSHGAPSSTHDSHGFAPTDGLPHERAHALESTYETRMSHRFIGRLLDRARSLARALRRRHRADVLDRMIHP